MRPVRGRVIAVDGESHARRAVVRGAHAELDVAAGDGWRPGDLVDGAARVRPWTGGDYPTPATEVARLPRTRLRNLEARSRAMAAARAVFSARGFLEVETPLVVPQPGLEVHLQAVPAGRGEWLITSPEFQMKRLLAAGMERIFQICRCHRDEEAGAHHAREFTMIEWYRAWDDLDAIIADTEALVAAVVTAVQGRPVARLGAREIDVTPPWPRITVRDAMARYAGVVVEGDEDVATLRAGIRAAGIAVDDGAAWDDVFFAAFLERVEPALAASDRPVLLVDWPLPLGALARPSERDPRVVERVEAYVAGLELANGFGELTDPVEQRRRFEADRAARVRHGRNPHAVDERFLAALHEGIPPSAGIALGFDRVVMLATGATQIRDVQAFAGDEL
jgi:lysyl-tRNA synthetase class 2